MLIGLTDKNQVEQNIQCVPIYVKNEKPELLISICLNRYVSVEEGWGGGCGGAGGGFKTSHSPRLGVARIMLLEGVKMILFSPMVLSVCRKKGKGNRLLERECGQDPSGSCDCLPQERASWHLPVVISVLES